MLERKGGKYLKVQFHQGSLKIIKQLTLEYREISFHTKQVYKVLAKVQSLDISYIMML